MSCGSVSRLCPNASRRWSDAWTQLSSPVLRGAPSSRSTVRRSFRTLKRFSMPSNGPWPRSAQVAEALRVDVIAGFLAPAGLLRDFHRVHPDVDLDIATLPNGAAAIAAVRDGEIDAAFRALRTPLGADLIATRVFDEPLQLLTGPAHPLADAASLKLTDLQGRVIWMPGNLAGTEWSAYYDELAAAFGFSIDTTGPNFGLDVMLDGLADDPARATFVGEQTRFRWPESYKLRRIDFRDPTPVYPHSLIRRADNRHPALAALGNHFTVPVATTSVWSGRGHQAGDQGA